MTVCAAENANDSYLAQSVAERDIGHIWERRSNRTYNFVYSVITILKIVVDKRLVNQRGVWDGSSEVRCEDWVRNGKVIRMSGFGVVLLSVWSWWGAWVQGNVYCGGWMICCRKRRKSGVWCSGDTINLLSGAYSLGQIILRQIDVSGPLDCACGQNSDAFFDFLVVRTSVVEWAVEWAVKKPLGRVQKVADYPRFLG